MAAINRGNISKQLVPGLNAIFGTEYGEIDNEHTVLFDTESSERAFEEELLWSGLGTAPGKSEGAAVEFDNAQELWTSRYTHETIALAFAITEEAMEDNLYDTFSKVRAKGLARAMATTKQIKAANIFNNGFSTSFAIGDGAALFSASHPTLGAGNLSNTVAVDLSETALENALINISLLVDDRNILIGAQGKSLHIPPQLQFVAHRILKSPLRQGTADNDANALKDMGLLRSVHINHRFTDSNAWFIRTNVPNGSKYFERVGLSTKMDVDFHTGNMMYKARERYSFGVSDWRQWYGSSGAT
jgi:hypothetical protein